MTSSNGTNVSSVHIFKVFQNITTRFLIFLRSTLYSLRKLQNVDYKAIPIVTMRNVYIIQGVPKKTGISVQGSF